MQLIKLKEVIAMVGCSRNTIAKKMATNGFPRPVKLNGDLPKSPQKWSKQEIEKYLRKAIANRNALIKSEAHRDYAVGDPRFYSVRGAGAKTRAKIEAQKIDHAGGNK